MHVARADLSGILFRLAHALKPGGALYASFKYGTEERDTKLRRFTDMNEELLAAAIAAVGLTELDMWTSIDVRPERGGERWVSVIARR